MMNKKEYKDTIKRHIESPFATKPMNVFWKSKTGALLDADLYVKVGNETVDMDVKSVWFFSERNVLVYTDKFGTVTQVKPIVVLSKINELRVKNNIESDGSINFFSGAAY